MHQKGLCCADATSVPRKAQKRKTTAAKDAFIANLRAETFCNADNSVRSPGGSIPCALCLDHVSGGRIRMGGSRSAVVVVTKDSYVRASWRLDLKIAHCPGPKNSIRVNGHQSLGYYGRLTKVSMGSRPMGNHAVTLKVAPFVRLECKFWLTDDGWNGSCEQPRITVQAGSFEHAKSEMESALGKYIEDLLRELPRTTTGQAA